MNNETQANTTTTYKGLTQEEITARVEAMPSPLEVNVMTDEQLDNANIDYDLVEQEFMRLLNEATS